MGISSQVIHNDVKVFKGTRQKEKLTKYHRNTTIYNSHQLANTIYQSHAEEKANKNGENTEPCLTPTLTGNAADHTLAYSTQL